MTVVRGTAEMCRNVAINLQGCTNFTGFCSNCCDYESAKAWRDFIPGFCWLCSSPSQFGPEAKKNALRGLWMGHTQEHSCWLTANWANFPLILNVIGNVFVPTHSRDWLSHFHLLPSHTDLVFLSFSSVLKCNGQCPFLILDMGLLKVQTVEQIMFPGRFSSLCPSRAPSNIFFSALFIVFVKM